MRVGTRGIPARSTADGVRLMLIAAFLFDERRVVEFFKRGSVCPAVLYAAVLENTIYEKRKLVPNRRKLAVLMNGARASRTGAAVLVV